MTSVVRRAGPRRNFGGDPARPALPPLRLLQRLRCEDRLEARRRSAGRAGVEQRTGWAFGGHGTLGSSVAGELMGLGGWRLKRAGQAGAFWSNQASTRMARACKRGRYPGSGWKQSV